ncbi:hypothetical protein T484DRAFT_1831691 [Baffinella frigidus]|nr:hypothetical protein T484DRAFT_1831691 [Cryptophyta sp. CCMP2293]
MKLIGILGAGPPPVFEPGLEELVNSLRGKNLVFTSSLEQTVKDSQVLFVCINTPLKTGGAGAGRAADLSGWENMARRIAIASKVLSEASSPGGLSGT